MIVCSIPRCGATAFCLDLQDQTGIPFVGELNPLYMFENKKAEYHETKHQQDFTPNSFADLLYDNKNSIVMINKSSYLLANRADYVILRRNMMDAFMSYANFMLKIHPYIDTRVLIQELKITASDYAGLKSYIDKYVCNIVWYEDYFGMSGTQTPILDSHKHALVIKKAVQDVFKER